MSGFQLKKRWVSILLAAVVGSALFSVPFPVNAATGDPDKLTVTVDEPSVMEVLIITPDEEELTLTPGKTTSVGAGCSWYDISPELKEPYDYLYGWIDCSLTIKGTDVESGPVDEEIDTNMICNMTPNGSSYSLHLKKVVSKTKEEAAFSGGEKIRYGTTKSEPLENVLGLLQYTGRAVMTETTEGSRIVRTYTITDNAGKKHLIINDYPKEALSDDDDPDDWWIIQSQEYGLATVSVTVAGTTLQGKLTLNKDKAPQNAQETELHLKWLEEGGKHYWYENGTRQGMEGDPKNIIDAVFKTERGREIYDPASNAWYWLDSIYGGAKAANKEVWMPYIYQEESAWGADKIDAVAAASGTMAEQVKQAILNHTGKWVRYDANGAMIKGWYTVKDQDAAIYPDQNGNTYYYDEITGLMAKGWTVIEGNSYHFDEVTGALR